MKRSFAVMVAAIVLAACPSDAVDPGDPDAYHGDGSPASADRTLVLASCQTMYNTQYATPCTTYSSGTLTKKVDSSRVVLRRDFSASWMAGGTDRTVTCGQSSCATTTIYAESGNGTYAIVGDTIKLTLIIDGATTQRSLFGKFPAGIDSHWPGPDSLIVAPYGPTYTTLIYKPQ